MLLSGGPKSYDGEILYLASYIYVVIIVNKAFFCLCKKGKKKKKESCMSVIMRLSQCNGSLDRRNFVGNMKMNALFLPTRVRR